MTDALRWSQDQAFQEEAIAKAQATSGNVIQEPNERQCCWSNMNRESGKRGARERENVQGKECGFPFQEELLESFRQDSDVIDQKYLPQLKWKNIKTFKY